MHKEGVRVLHHARGHDGVQEGGVLRELLWCHHLLRAGEAVVVVQQRTEAREGGPREHGRRHGREQVQRGRVAGLVRFLAVLQVDDVVHACWCAQSDDMDTQTQVTRRVKCRANRTKIAGTRDAITTFMRKAEKGSAEHGMRRDRRGWEDGITQTTGQNARLRTRRETVIVQVPHLAACSFQTLKLSGSGHDNGQRRTSSGRVPTAAGFRGHHGVMRAQRRQSRHKTSSREVSRRAVGLPVPTVGSERLSNAALHAGWGTADCLRDIRLQVVVHKRLESSTGQLTTNPHVLIHAQLPGVQASGKGVHRTGG